MEQSKDRLRVIEKRKEYERLGLFDIDLEDDPPFRALEAGEVDYLGKKRWSRLLTFVANAVARSHFEKQIKKGEMIIKRVNGIENFEAVKDKGVIITANHFNANDNYAIYKALEASLGKKKLYKMIREGNYTGFKGLYGFFFRHCNTLPIPSKHSAYKEMLIALKTLLARTEKVLIYPEQAMWWNYKKPRPLKYGAFHFAITAGVPVLPIFITMSDSGKIGKDGFDIPEYTVNILKPIYPQSELSMRECEREMAKQNFKAWKECYEDFYQIPLTYESEEF